MGEGFNKESLAIDITADSIKAQKSITDLSKELKRLQAFQSNFMKGGMGFDQVEAQIDSVAKKIAQLKLINKQNLSQIKKLVPELDPETVADPFKGVGKVSKRITEGGFIHVEKLDMLGKKVRLASDGIEILSAKVKKNKVEFAGWAMSIMFAGMAIQRIFSSIQKFGTKTFDEITHSVEGATTKNDQLQGSLRYLGFVVGEALDPFIAKLIPIVEWVADLAEKFPGLTRFIIIAGIALGTLAMVGGSTVLAFNGIREAIILAFGTDILASITKAGGLFGMLKTEVIATWAALQGMSMMSLVGFGAMIAGILLAIMYIFKLKDAMGGWGEVFKSVARGILRANVLMAESFVWLGNMIVTGVVWALNKLIDVINRLLQSSLVQWGLGKLGIKGGSIEKIQASEYQWGDAFLSKYSEWEQNSALAPSKGYSTSMSAVPTYNVNINKIESTADTLPKLMEDLKKYGVK